MPATAESIRASWLDPVQRAKRMAGMAAGRLDPEKQARRTAAIKAAMQRPDVKAKLRQSANCPDLIAQRVKAKMDTMAKMAKPKATFSSPWNFGRELTKEEKSYVRKCRQCGLKIEDVAKVLKTVIAP